MDFFCNVSELEADRIRKDISSIFKNYSLIITIQTNSKIINYLDVTFNLYNGSHCPDRRPNDQPLYINTKSNHSPSILKHLPKAINHRISEIEKAIPVYEGALKSSRYASTMTYRKHVPSTQSGGNRK